MDIVQLKEKANSLPLSPGVYLMKDKSGQVIYVGKAKKLKNRVSQYFQDTASHGPKTKLMVSRVSSFDVIVAASEFEALVLECSLIKQHMPKYNILLKDDKGYPFIRLDIKSRYPKLTIASKVLQDGAEYFGPFGSRSVTNQLITTLQSVMKLPTCTKKFPKDIGKSRPCLNYQMGKCDGWCRSAEMENAHKERIDQVRQLLSGDYKKALEQIRMQMQTAAEAMEFELAASLRDKLRALEALGQKQLVTAGKRVDTDVIGFAQTEAKACFSVLHFCGGNLMDKEFETFTATEDPAAAVSALVKQYYLCKGTAPKRILVPYEFDDQALFEQLLLEQYGKKISIHNPKRGDNVRLIELANTNALEEARRITSLQDKRNATVALFARMVSCESANRIESYDISNISGTDIVASMVVFENGQPKRSEYKKFKIQLDNQDDYASMHQVLLRRFTHFCNRDEGFDKKPDLLLIDGGAEHARVACSVLEQFDLNIPIFGMVKDDRHRTRALVTSDERQINIDSQPAVFSFVGTIQEETHRFAISYHRQLRSKRLRKSKLDDIPGVGPVRKQELLRFFKSINAISNATIPELERVLPKPAAYQVYKHFHPVTEGESECE